MKSSTVVSCLETTKGLTIDLLFVKIMHELI